MTQIAEDLRILNEDEQNEAYEKAKRKLDERDANWKAEQDRFLDENPELRDDPDLNLAFVAEVNRLISTIEGMAISDRRVLERAYVNLHLRRM